MDSTIRREDQTTMFDRVNEGLTFPTQLFTGIYVAVSLDRDFTALLLNGLRLVGQRHFVADFCRKLWPDNTISHGVYVSGGMQDLILSTSIPMAVSRSILVFVCDLRACLFRRW